MPKPQASDLLVRMLEVGICGTDRDLMLGRYGTPPHGDERLIIGHESLGEVVTAPISSGLLTGDLVVGIVRHPDPIPCSQCAQGNWDMCKNGLYLERGIKSLDGFCAEYVAVAPSFVVKVPSDLRQTAILVEPASIVAKAWAQINLISAQRQIAPARVLVMGAGPVGLLAALFGAEQGLDVHVFDRIDDGIKPKLVRDLGANYHTDRISDVPEPEIIIDCTGAATLIVEAISAVAANGIVCLAGLSTGQPAVTVPSKLFGSEMVLRNKVLFGTVNANRTHYETAIRVLETANQNWLQRLVTRQVPLSRWQSAFERQPNDVKTVLYIPG
jgi:threonine dehydrogenase-like Zn-dependent dehydrogenase